MIKDLKIKAILDNILQSEDFRKSVNYQVLLKYLVEHSLKGDVPKETSIAIDVFHKGKEFNPAEDTTVRYYMHNLRKKLDTYYQREGKDEKLRLVIDKGHYKVEFKEVPVKSRNPFKKKPSTINLVVVFSFIILCSVIIFQWQKFTTFKRSVQPVNNKDPLWSDFMRNDSPNMLVIGDLFVFIEYQEDRGRNQMIKDWSVNNSKDLDDYIAQFQIKGIHKTEQNVFPYSSVYTLHCLMPIFSAVSKKLLLKASSELTWKDIKTNNIIFVGKFGSTQILRKFFNNLSIHLQKYHQNKIFITNDKRDTLHTFTRIRTAVGPSALTTQYYNRDYAIIAKLPGPEGNSILLISGFGHIALLESVKIMCNPVLRNEMLNDYLSKKVKIDPYFEMLIEIEGIKQTGLNKKIRYYRPIKDKFNPISYSGFSNGDNPQQSTE